MFTGKMNDLLIAEDTLLYGHGRILAPNMASQTVRNIRLRQHRIRWKHGLCQLHVHVGWT